MKHYELVPFNFTKGAKIKEMPKRINLHQFAVFIKTFQWVFGGISDALFSVFIYRALWEIPKLFPVLLPFL